MTKQKVIKAITEAERFLAIAYVVRERAATDDVDILWASKETAAVRRASMDLTRALAEMRSRD